MISLETTQAFLGEMNVEKDKNYLLRQLAEFGAKEPYLCAFISVVLSNSRVIDNPVTCAFMALSMYESMRLSQANADELKRTLGQDHEKGKGSA